MDLELDRKEVVYWFNDQVILRNQSAQEIGIQDWGVIRAVRVT